MTNLVIGSVAARHWFPDWREPEDFDIFSDTVEPASVGFAYGASDLRVEPFWHDALNALLVHGENRIATPDELYTIKFSHSFWELRNGSWAKHMYDLLELKKRGAQLIPEWYDVLYGIWEATHGRKKVDLTQEADEFFSDAVTRKYEHDSIHLSVAYEPGKPIYDTVLKDGKSVQMDMAKVWAMPHERIVQMFREEVYVTALERKIIPSGYSHSPGAAYQWALRRTITSLTRGRSARFMVENFETFRRPDMDYVAWHKKHSDMLIPLESGATPAAT